ncbi:MAG: amine dehydrogenase [Burkholderiales bacterium]|jgi:methylamine dehydrogenase heavy chain|nr:amine dehydrogenase [Burkholderiales bacterium]
MRVLVAGSDSFAGAARRLAGWCGALALALPLACMAAGPAKKGSPPPELERETLTSGPIAAEMKERVYVADIAISHISDGRVRVFDARGGKFLGMISTAYAGNFTVSDKRDEVYVATSHLARSTRGERTDVLEVYDTQSLAFKYEVVLPPKRAQALNYRGLVRASGNGRLVLVQNATPATSITVVDLAGRKVLNEIATPGCWGILPAAGHGTRLSMLCGDGTVATLTLDDAGQVTDRQVSRKLFDPDNDAWFHHAEQVGDRYWFVSFQGQLTELDLGGPSAQVKSQRWLVDDAQKRQGWRPGGYQNFAVDPAARWLVLGMHDKGSEGSHKRPARQLWAFDLGTGKRVATAAGHGTVSLTFSRSGQRLNAIDGETGTLRTWQFNAGALKPMAVVAPAGEAPLHLESHD